MMLLLSMYLSTINCCWCCCCCCCCYCCYCCYCCCRRCCSCCSCCQLLLLSSSSTKVSLIRTHFILFCMPKIEGALPRSPWPAGRIGGNCGGREDIAYEHDIQLSGHSCWFLKVVSKTCQTTQPLWLKNTTQTLNIFERKHADSALHEKKGTALECRELVDAKRDDIKLYTHIIMAPPQVSEVFPTEVPWRLFAAQGAHAQLPWQSHPGETKPERIDW